MGKQSFPTLFRWVGGIVPDAWSFGWLTGEDNDLICVKPDLISYQEVNICLSPVCRNMLLAFVGFVLKRALLSIDENMQIDYHEKVAL
jgi:hypothetical protein